MWPGIMSSEMMREQLLLGPGGPPPKTYERKLVGRK